MGEELTLTATTQSGTDTSYNWSSNNTSVATVGSNGVVKGISEGADIVTAGGNQTQAKGYATIYVLPVEELTITPKTTTLEPGGSQNFSVTGGTAPYTWSMKQNVSGGSLSSYTGQTVTYTAGETKGEDIIEVHDATGKTATATIKVGQEQLTITPSEAQVKRGESLELVSSGASGVSLSYLWSIIQNQSGATLNTTTGAKVRYTAGYKDGIDIIQVRDAAGYTATATITVGAGRPTPDLVGAFFTTYPDFLDYLILTNPGTSPATVTLSFSTGEEKELSLAANQSEFISINDLIGPDKLGGFKIYTSGVPVKADSWVFTPADNLHVPVLPHQNVNDIIYYNTTAGLSTYVILYNTSNSEVTSTVKLYDEAGGLAATKSYILSPTGQAIINVQDIVGGGKAGSMAFSHRGLSGGGKVVGAAMLITADDIYYIPCYIPCIPKETVSPFSSSAQARDIRASSLTITASPSTTVQVSGTVTLTASGSTAAVPTYSWGIIDNQSGGRLSSDRGTTVTYTAGTVNGVDTIQVRDSLGVTATIALTVVGGKEEMDLAGAFYDTRSGRDTLVALLTTDSRPTDATITFTSGGQQTIHLKPHRVEMLLVSQVKGVGGGKSGGIKVRAAGNILGASWILSTTQADNFYVPLRRLTKATFGRFFNTSSELALYNTNSSPQAVKLDFYESASGALMTTLSLNLGPDEMKLLDLAEVAGIGKNKVGYFKINQGRRGSRGSRLPEPHLPYR